MDDLHDPIVIDPPGFDVKAGWDECNEASKHVVGPDGGTNWRAAFSADPGVTSCPSCHRMHWAWGRVQRCTGCGFEYPVGWWSMYAWGVAAARQKDPYKLADRLRHPYYRYGYEHPVEDTWAEHHKIPWKEVVGPLPPDLPGS